MARDGMTDVTLNTGSGSRTLIVDHVYTWVNDKDVDLNALRAGYASSEVLEDVDYRAGLARVADFGELKAGIENALRYLPFVRNTYIFGSGRPPEWLGEFGDKVRYVTQGDVIPPHLWPSFQSDIAESFIHRIPGLSEHYIYSNDDFFFAREHSALDFFTEAGLARIGLARWPAAAGPAGTYRAIESNGVRALQERFDLPAYAGRYSPIATARGIRERISMLRRRKRLFQAGLKMVNGISHVSQPYLKSEWTSFHATFAPELAKLFANRFRSEQGIGVNFVYHHYLNSTGKAEFYDAADQDRLLNRPDVEGRERLRRDLLDPDFTIRKFCLNDAPSQGEDGWAEFLQSVLRDLKQRDDVSTTGNGANVIPD